MLEISSLGFYSKSDNTWRFFETFCDLEFQSETEYDGEQLFANIRIGCNSDDYKEIPITKEEALMLQRIYKEKTESIIS